MLEKLLKAVRLEDEDDYEEELSLKEKSVSVIIAALILGAILLCVFSFGMDNEEIESVRDSVNAEGYLSDDGETIRYDSKGAYLEKDGKAISGYYKIIEEDYDSELLRVIGTNGLYGYISKATGEEEINPCFTEASPMKYGSACVSKDGKNFYYISEDGERITRDYEEAYLWESQGTLARVKNSNGWAIIDRKDRTVLDKCTLINELPEVTAEGTAVKDGNALLFNVWDEEGLYKTSVVAEIPEISDISVLYYNEFAVIKGADGYGAVSAGGKVIVSPEYKTIDWKAIPLEGDDYGYKIIFKCQKENGTYETVTWNPY